MGARSLDVAALGRLGLTRAQLEDAVWLVDESGATSGADAVLRVLASKGRASRALGRVLSWTPMLVVAHRSYRFVARHRRSISRVIGAVSIRVRARRANARPR